MPTVLRAADIVPAEADLPGSGWLAIDEGFGSEGGDGPGTMLDCVGSDFPEHAVVETASSPHFVRPPAMLVHGTGVRFETEGHAEAAHGILGGPGFAACLGRSVAADIDSAGVDAELLAVDVAETAHGHRVCFTGGNDRGVRPVNLDVASLRIGATVCVLWCGDTPGTFPASALVELLARIRTRADR